MGVAKPCQAAPNRRAEPRTKGPAAPGECGPGGGDLIVGAQKQLGVVVIEHREDVSRGGAQGKREPEIERLSQNADSISTASAREDLVSDFKLEKSRDVLAHSIAGVGPESYRAQAPRYGQLGRSCRRCLAEVGIAPHSWKRDCCHNREVYSLQSGVDFEMMLTKAILESDLGRLNVAATSSARRR